MTTVATTTTATTTTTIMNTMVYLLLGMNFLVTAPVPFVFAFGCDAPIDPNDAGAVGIFKEYSWNPLFRKTFGLTVPVTSLGWFALVRYHDKIPTHWKLFPSVVVSVVGVLYINVWVEDKFLMENYGAGMPTSGFIAHYIQAMAFASILLVQGDNNLKKPQQQRQQQQQQTPLWAYGLWWALATIHALRLSKIVSCLLSGSGAANNLNNDAVCQQLYDYENHALATGSLIWNQIGHMGTTLALSWYAPAGSILGKIIPFGILSFGELFVVFATQQESVSMTNWIIAIVYLLQIWIPGSHPTTTTTTTTQETNNNQKKKMV